LREKGGGGDLFTDIGIGCPLSSPLSEGSSCSCMGQHQQQQQQQQQQKIGRKEEEMVIMITE